ncbi:MAG: hypothetical protein OEW65_05895, partial [Thermoleophilia bacterium]|nr:hypothetical protein [Thermoleophilia bacterium]
AEISITAPGVDRVVVVPTGGRVVLRLPVETTGPWTAELRATRPLLASGSGLIACFAGIPRFVEAPDRMGEKA